MRGFLLILALLNVVTPSPAYSNTKNRNVLPLGERESFLGNAGIGGADSTGAVYYNPAALSLLPEKRISVSGSNYLSFRFDANPAIEVDSTPISYEASGFNSIPTSVVSHFRLGDWTLTYSVLVPDALELQMIKTVSTPNTLTTGVQKVLISDLWLGLSTSKKLTENWSTGLTVFGIKHEENELLDLVSRSKASPNDANYLISDMRFQSLGISILGGILFHPSDQFRIGFKIQSPFIQAKFTGSTFTHNDEGGVITEAIRTSVDSEYKFPWDLGLGVSFSPTSRLSAFWDVSLQTGLTYFAPEKSFGTASLKPTFRSNFGTEFRLSDGFSYLIGGFINPSAGSPSTDTTNRNIQENYGGITSGVYFKTSSFRTGIGIMYLRSTGNIQNTFFSTTTTGAFSKETFGAALGITYLR